MATQYHIDAEKFSLRKFKTSIKSREMIPSRKSLKDDLDDRFRVLEECGLTNLKGLLDVLRTKHKIEEFSKETGLSVDYLTLLRREANSYFPKPVQLHKFPGISGQYTEMLSARGIKHSRHLFIQASRKVDRDRLSQELDVPLEVLDELLSLSDLSRAYGIGPVFARMIYDVGVRSIQEFLQYSADELINLYEEQTQKKADFGVNEIQFSLELANWLEHSIEL